MFIVNNRRTSVVSNATESVDFSENARTGPYLEGNLKLIGTIDCSTDVMCCRFSPDGQHLAVGLIDGSVKIYSPSTYQCLYSLQDTDTQKKHLPVTQIRFRLYSSDEKPEYSHILIASYASGLVKFWHYTSGKCLHTINEVRQTLNIAVNPDGTRFLTTGDSPQIHVYDEDTKKRINTLEPSDSRDKMDGHHFRVFAAQYHPNFPHVFISGGWDNTVHFWDDRQRQSIRLISGPHICGEALDIDPIHNHILTGSWRKIDVLQIWDFASAEKIKDVPPEPMNDSLLYCCQWLGKENIICGGSDMNMARVIDRGTLNTTGHLCELPQGVYCIDNDGHGNSPLVAIGSSNNIYLVRSEKKIS
ncbi:WD repeat-containing protein 5-like [Saccostrea echinata]|uniref:WD repeat-containing protein 5-like n=1 Tax=Saccostrea echinata TaxID=191078 RepID=UPI002A8348F1|nr:WD repeat-containing protein 5-like [Saccostrea echinata]